MGLGSQLAELFVKIGIQADDKKLKLVDSELKSVTKTLGGMKAVAGGVALVLQQVASIKLASITAEEQKFAKLTGAIAENVDAFKMLAVQSQVSEGTVTGAIQAIARQKQDLLTMKSIPMWVRFGIDPNQSPDKVLKDILTKVKKYTGDTQRQMALLNRLGVSSEFALMLKEGKLDIDEATASLIRFKNINADSSTELTKNVSTTKTIFKSVAQGLNGILTPIMNVGATLLNKLILSLSSKILPMLEKVGHIIKTFSDTLVSFIERHKGLVNLIAKILVFIGSIVAVLLVVKSIMLGLFAISKLVIIIKTILGLLFSIKNVMLLIHGLNPLTWILLIAGAIGLIWKKLSPDTFNAFLRGAWLLLQDFFDWLDGVPNTIIGDTLKRWGDYWETVGLGFMDLWDKVKNGISSFIDWVKSIFTGIGNFVKGIFEGIIDGIAKAIEAVKNKIMAVKNFGKKLAFWKDDEEEGEAPKPPVDIENLRRFFPDSTQNKVYSTQAPSQENNFQTEMKTEINITTSSDNPQEVASAVKGAVQSSNNSFSNKFKSEMQNASLVNNTGYAK